MKIKSWLFILPVIILLIGTFLAYRINARLNPTPTIKDSPTTIIGFNHIGISVKNLDKMLAFYQEATDFKLLKRTSIDSNQTANILFGQEGISYEKAILKGPNMLLELTQFTPQTEDSIIHKMLPQEPGMPHTCYQSPTTDSAYDKFKKAGVIMLSRGNEPVDLGGYGVTYAYAYDPEGNMMELEQMSDFLIGLKIGKDWAKKNPIWLTQVALISPNLPELTAFYQKILEIKAYRIGEYRDNPGFDAIINVDNGAFDAAWFGMDTQGKKLELMQYINPPTPKNLSQKSLTDLGYTFSFEVLNIQKEYKRLKNSGVKFVSKPQLVEGFWEVFAHDIDGNVFSLRQVVEKESVYSLKNF